MNPYGESSKNQNDFWSQQNYDFGQFDYSRQDQQQQQQHHQQQQGGNYSSGGGSFFAPPPPPPAQPFIPAPISGQFDQYGGGVGDPYAAEEEPPLLEELGINFEHIMAKTFAVLNPFKRTDANILQDADLAGPLVFGLAFGSLLLLSGKIHFSYIYGFGVLGCMLIFGLLTLMSPPNVTFSAVCTLSILGYCLLPMVFLAAIAIFAALNTTIGMWIAMLFIAWCAASASKLFVTALGMQNQQALIAYPCFLFYGVFALLALF